METEELVQGQRFVWALTPDRLSLSHPDPFSSILQLGGLFLWPSLVFCTTFWGAISFVVRPERRWVRGEVRHQRRWLRSWLAEFQALSPAVVRATCFRGTEEKPTADSYEMSYPWESFLLNCCQLKDVASSTLFFFYIYLLLKF